ncbi:hypothetical protein BIW11_03475 [Tropilaelaps mercedesae]|uniref:Glutaredoxin domain-containing protein n=1 Tax=Tropilaelaps mercedesae TaxID=418985 RepID=A0A1V9XKR5_9ACAR|nr:hypothetical protein BIW11_03475 [Tropilaelaps mercedesae]
MAALRLLKDLVARNPLIVFSKTTCPYCQLVHSILVSDLGAGFAFKAKAEFVQLDTRDDGPEIQNALQEMTGSRTVPKVFIGGSLIGGCDDTRKLQENGKLIEILAKAGIQMAKAARSPSVQGDKAKL